MDHDRGAKACLVGKHAPFHSPLNGELDPVADGAARRGLHSEGTFENRLENSAELNFIYKEDLGLYFVSDSAKEIMEYLA